MNDVLELELYGNCYLCDAEDVKVWVYVDKQGKGHLLCKGCIETLVEWGVIPQLPFELKDEE